MNTGIRYPSSSVPAWSRRLTLFLLLPVAGVIWAEQAPDASTATAEGDEPAFEILQQQARYWVNRGRGDLAAGALRRILASDPDNADALYEIGLLMISEGDITSARTFETRLRRQEDAYDKALLLRREVDNAEVDRNLLAEARRRAAEGEIEVALGLYEKLFSGREIGGRLAIEYYETLAGMEERWNEAADGLRYHHDRQPSNGRVLLALAKVLSYREETRREALFHFTTLLDDAVFREDALKSMRDTLLWLNASPDDQGYYDRYLSIVQDDAIAEKLALALNPKVIDAFTAARIEAYKALNQGQLQLAEQRFTELLEQRSNDAESLGGMGIVRLRKQQFGSAVDYFNRAIRADASTTRNFGAALEEARFWNAYQDTNSLIDRGDFDRALDTANRLTSSNASRQAQIHLLKARIATATGDWSEAERQCRQALALESTNAQAAATLLDVLGVQTRYQELSQQITQFERQTARGDFKGAPVHSAIRRGQAQVAVWKEDWSTALAAYEQAVRADPDNVWLRLEYARLLIRLDRNREAEALMAGLSRPGSDKDSTFALALYYADIENWDRCLSTLEKLPENARSKEATTLAEMAQIKNRIDLAMQRNSMGDHNTAVSEMLALQEYRTTSPYKTMLVADGLLKLGLNEQAGLMVKRALSSESPSTDVLVQYARILAEAGELNSAYKLMTDIMLRRNELSSAQRAQMASVYDDILLRASRLAIDSNQYELALSYLEPIYRNDPLDGTVLRHLGEVHQRMGDYTGARRFYESAMAVDTSDLWAVKGAVGAALDEEDIESASRILDTALSRFPNNPDVYTLISRTAHSANDLDMAIEAAERAKRLKRDNDLPTVEAPYRYEVPQRERPPTMSPQNPFRAQDSRNRSNQQAGGAVRRTSPQRNVSAGKPAWHEGWRMVPVAAQIDPQAQKDATTPADSGNWDIPESGESLNALIQAEIESTRQAMAISSPAPDQQSSATTVQGLPTGLAFDTIVQLVDVLAQQGKHDQVEQVVLSVLQGNNLDDSESARLTTLLFPSALHLAEAALDRNDSESAFAHLRPVLNLPSSEADVRFLTVMARYSRSIGELDKSATMYERALLLTPGDEALRIEAVAVQMQRNDLPTANVMAVAGLERDPNSVRLNLLVGRIAKELGDLDSAMEHFLIASQAQSGSLPQNATVSVAPSVASRSYEPVVPDTRQLPTPAFQQAPVYPAPKSEVNLSRPADLGRATWVEVEDLDTLAVQSAASNRSWNQASVVQVAAEEQPRSPSSSGSQDDIRERLRSLGREGPAGREAPSAQRSSALGNTFDSELESLRAEASPFFGVSGGFRYRDGEEGLSQLTEFRAPLEFDFNPYEGRLKLLVEPIYLSAGDFGDDPNRARRFGTLALVEEEARFAPVDDSVGGIGIIFGYTTGDLTVDIGSTPIGFEIMNAVGGINITHSFDNGFSMGVDVSRRAVSESLLSYAGTVDPLTNEEWGAIVNNEITMEIGKSFTGFSVYGDAWYGINTGTAVDDNEHFGTDFGFTIDVWQRPGRSLRVGFNTTYFAYDENLRFFTLGHGGYFSPQSFFSSSVPIDYELSTDRLQLRFSGAIGVQYYSEDAAFYYPNRTDLQNELFEFEFEQPVIYDGQSETDISFRASSELIYKLTPRMQLRTSIGVERTADWTESIGLLSFQYRPGL